MESTKKRDWVLIVIGILMVLCGFTIWFTPVATLIAITILAGAGFLVTGIIDIIEYVRYRNVSGVPGWAALYAVLDIILGIMLLLHPGVFSLFLPWLVGAGIIAFGLFEVFGAVKARNLPGVPWGWMLFSAIVNIILGIMFIVYPAMLALFVALFVIMRGVTLVVFGATAKQGLM